MNGKCLQCGKLFEVGYPCFVRTRKFCTKACATTYRWAHDKSHRLLFLCEVCGKEFEVKKSDHRIKEGKPIRYCSTKCAGIGSRVSKIKKCPICGKEFYSTRTRYCSYKCAMVSKRDEKKYNAYIESGHWKPTHIYSEKYLVSDKGEIYSATTDTIIKPFFNGDGYVHYNLGISRKEHKQFSAHRLVAMAFIPNPDSKPQIDHINGNRQDNRVENLRWTTAKENMNNINTIPKHRAAVKRNIEKYNKNRLVAVAVYKDGELVKTFSNSSDAAKFVGSTRQNVSSCLLGRRKTAKGYTFKHIKEV